MTRSRRISKMSAFDSKRTSPDRVTRPHSGFMPANFTTFAHFSVSSEMSLPKSHTLKIERALLAQHWQTQVATRVLNEVASRERINAGDHGSSMNPIHHLELVAGGRGDV